MTLTKLGIEDYFHISTLKRLFSYFITGIEEFSERLAPSCLSESIGVFKEADVHDLLLNYYVLSRDFKQLSFSWFFAETKY